MSPSNPVPQHVTRFYGNVGYALDTLANIQITFLHVSTLNDPFDPYFFLETDFQEKRQKLLRYVEEHHPESVGWFKRRITAGSWAQTMLDLTAKLASWRKSTFVFSTSGEQDGFHPKDNLYMWGHYGNGHRGVAIEFDAHLLAQAALEQHEKLNNAPSPVQDVWCQIEYSQTFAPITASDFFEFMSQENDFHSGRIIQRQETTLTRYYARMGRVKSKVWQAEHEWRLMWTSDETRMKIQRCPIGNEAVTAVFLGLNLPSSTKADFVYETKRNFPRAKVLHAKKRYGDFALEFEQL